MTNKSHLCATGVRGRALHDLAMIGALERIARNRDEPGHAESATRQRHVRQTATLRQTTMTAFRTISRLQAAQGAAAALSAAVLASLGCGAASAQQRAGSDNCAIYGSGFVAVQGASTCVRIGGRVRLELNGAGASAGLNSFAPVNNSPSAPASGGIDRAHMRLDSAPARGRR